MFHSVMDRAARQRLVRDIITPAIPRWGLEHSVIERTRQSRREVYLVRRFFALLTRESFSLKDVPEGTATDHSTLESSCLSPAL
jgi:hypothetical protein